MIPPQDPQSVSAQNPEDVVVDAQLLAALFEITPDALKTAMRSGTVTSLCERGTQEHEGLYRLSFFYGSRRVRLNLNQLGEVLTRSVVDFAEAPLPAAMRRPGG
jgi:Family of unknown function (DUF6522)